MSEVIYIRKVIIRPALVLLLTGVCIAILLAGCTLSFHNISTHGSAEDLVDEQQTTSPDVKPNLNIPITPAAIP